MKKVLLIFTTCIILSGYSQTPLFQNSNENIWTGAGNSAACTTSGLGTIQSTSFLRVFDTDNYPLQDTAFLVYIEMGVRECTGGAYNLIGRVYKLDGILEYANMTLIAADTTAAYPDSSVYKMKIPFDEGYVLPGDTVVAEVFAPLNNAVTFFPGANPYAESGPSYFSALGCSFPEPVTFSSADYPGVKLILKLWVNHKPSLTAISATGFQDNVLNFNKSDFDQAWSDHDNDTLTMLRFHTLPANGVLELNGGSVLLGDSLWSHQIDSLNYIPNGGYLGDDDFTVTVRDGYHWSNTLTVVNIDVITWQLGLEEEPVSVGIIYPNPVTDFLTINYENPLKSYKIVDAKGKEIVLQVNQLNQINVTELPAGTYFFIAETEEGRSVNQFIKL